jgi:transcriptional regulator with GAF, ATPase, and Fis domain
MEREHVLRAIRSANWVIGGPNGAAARLGMKRTILAYRIRKLNIPLVLNERKRLYASQNQKGKSSI